MARRRDGSKTYKSGDPIHIVVTQDFVDDANRFFSHCREKGYNPSQIIRQAMVEWIRKEENGTVVDRQQESDHNHKDQASNFDKKLMDLLNEKPVKRPNKGMSLKTVKEILEGAN